ncbi:unnamed protein product [Danaus chrysippus]|uniref:(African queen) hypothetical protein n=1 Tax=Danaus chrysippus TaxID=151541 RepID=A0A8J2QIA0_9NEOP|nr:unnamed protein product [Danaus chrysippus]
MPYILEFKKVTLHGLTYDTFSDEPASGVAKALVVNTVGWPTTRSQACDISFRSAAPSVLQLHFSAREVSLDLEHFQELMARLKPSG